MHFFVIRLLFFFCFLFLFFPCQPIILTTMTKVTKVTKVTKTTTTQVAAAAAELARGLTTPEKTALVTTLGTTLQTMLE